MLVEVENISATDETPERLSVGDRKECHDGKLPRCEEVYVIDRPLKKQQSLI